MDKESATAFVWQEQRQPRVLDDQSVEKIGYVYYKPLLDVFVERLRQGLGARLVSLVLYGSVARGTARPDSDVDLLVVIEQNPQEQDGQAVVREIERELEKTPVYQMARERGLGCFVSSLVLTRAEADQNRYLYLDLTREALLLFDRDGFFRTRLAQMQARMRELGSVRIELPDGTWYWDVKPDLRIGEVFEL